jgi:predicted RNA methylase
MLVPLTLRAADTLPAQAMLAVGAALLGSPAVLGIDVDPDALEVAQANCEQFEDLPVRGEGRQAATAFQRCPPMASNRLPDA